jgi:hypothetical protein
LALGGVAWLVGLVGCSSTSNVDYQFGAADMEQVVVGTWSGTWGGAKGDGGAGDAEVGEGGASEGGAGAGGLVPFTLRIEHPRASAHPLCDPRVFASYRPLCVSTSEMPMKATLDVSDGSFAGTELTGTLRVPGAQLREADLSLKGTSTDVAIVAQWLAGKWLFCVANHATGIRLASCTLDSRTP